MQTNLNPASYALPVAQLENSIAGQAAAIGSTDSQSKIEQIKEVGEDFESLFLSLLLKEMRSSGTGEDGGLFAGESSDSYGGLFDMFLGQHLASSSPLGIQEIMVEQYRKQLGSSGSEGQSPVSGGGPGSQINAQPNSQ